MPDAIFDKCLEAGISIPAAAPKQLAEYLRSLIEWNQRMDLTAITNPQDIITRHFVDSLMPIGIDGMLPMDASVIDVGSGAGFPGLPLAIARPDIRVTLLDAQKKRVGFLSAVIDALSLTNVKVIHGRAEDTAAMPAHKESYDRAIARAVAPLNLLLEYLLPFVKIGGAALCWKGPLVAREWLDGEYAAASLGGRLKTPIKVSLPNEDFCLRLVLCEKETAISARFPRKAGIAAKRPLQNKP